MRSVEPCVRSRLSAPARTKVEDGPVPPSNLLINPGDCCSMTRAGGWRRQCAVRCSRSNGAEIGVVPGDFCLDTGVVRLTIASNRIGVPFSISW